MENETQPFTHGYDMHEIDTDDFIALCREIGAEPFLTINAAWDSPEVCAAWVEYCNGPAESKYGRLRAQRGHQEPYNVKWWSLGNEMGYGHMEGANTPDGYASLVETHARAMLKVTPDLKFVSSGPYPNQECRCFHQEAGSHCAIRFSAYVQFSPLGLHLSGGHGALL